MAPTSNPRSRRDRERDRQRAEEQAMQATYERAARRRAAIGIGVVVVVVLAVAGVVYAATNSGTRSATPTTTAAPSTTAASGPTVPLPPVTAGQAIAGTPPCPAPDGSSPRVTGFDAPPPMCIDPAGSYEAVITTSEGPMTVDLTAGEYPQAVNSFVFLARYHYYDGLPVTRIVPQAYAEVGDPPAPDGSPGPGFSIPNEATAKPPIASPLIVALVPNRDGTVGGAFLFGLTAKFSEIPANAPQVGTILDSRVDPNQKDPDPNVQQAVAAAATPSGAPSKVVTITRVTVTERA